MNCCDIWQLNLQFGNIKFDGSTSTNTCSHVCITHDKYMINFHFRLWVLIIRVLSKTSTYKKCRIEN